jgi:hypothetical protein
MKMNKSQSNNIFINNSKNDNSIVESDFLKLNNIFNSTSDTENDSNISEKNKEQKYGSMSEPLKNSNTSGVTKSSSDTSKKITQSTPEVSKSETNIFVKKSNTSSVTKSSSSTSKKTESDITKSSSSDNKESGSGNSNSNSNRKSNVDTESIVITKGSNSELDTTSEESCHITTDLYNFFAENFNPKFYKNVLNSKNYEHFFMDVKNFTKYSVDNNILWFSTVRYRVDTKIKHRKFLNMVRTQLLNIISNKIIKKIDDSLKLVHPSEKNSFKKLNSEHEYLYKLFDANSFDNLCDLIDFNYKPFSKLFGEAPVKDVLYGLAVKLLDKLNTMIQFCANERKHDVTRVYKYLLQRLYKTKTCIKIAYDDYIISFNKDLEFDRQFNVEKYIEIINGNYEKYGDTEGKLLFTTDDLDLYDQFVFMIVSMYRENVITDVPNIDMSHLDSNSLIASQSNQSLKGISLSDDSSFANYSNSTLHKFFGLEINVLIDYSLQTKITQNPTKVQPYYKNKKPKSKKPLTTETNKNTQYMALALFFGLTKLFGPSFVIILLSFLFKNIKAKLSLLLFSAMALLTNDNLIDKQKKKKKKNNKD